MTDLPTEVLEKLPPLDEEADPREVEVGLFDLELDPLEKEAEPESSDDYGVGIAEPSEQSGDEPAHDLDVGVNPITTWDEPADDDAGPATALAPDDFGLSNDAPPEDDTPGELDLADDGLEPLPELLVDDAEEEGTNFTDALPAALEGDLAAGPTYRVEWLVRSAAISALAVSAERVVAASSSLHVFDSAAHGKSLGALSRVSALALTRDHVYLAGVRGVIEIDLTTDTRRTLELASTERERTLEVTDLVAHGGDLLLVRLANGTVQRRRSGQWEHLAPGSRVSALSSGNAPVALLLESRPLSVQLSSDGADSFRERLLAEPAATIAGGQAPGIAALGNVLALWDRERGVCVSADGGESFRAVVGAVNVTALTVGEHAGKVWVFAALHHESRGASRLVLIDPETAHGSQIAELSGEEAEAEEEGEAGRTHVLGWSGSALLAAGGYGLARLEPPKSDEP